MMYNSSIAKKILAEKGSKIEYVVIKDADNNNHFFCLAIDEKKHQEMQLKIKRGLDFKPGDYGLILFYCEGNKPPQEFDNMIQELVNEYKNKGNII